MAKTEPTQKPNCQYDICTTNDLSKDFLILDSLDYAKNLARRHAYAIRANEVEKDELISVAYLALVQARQRYDPAKANGGAFRTFAHYAITGRLQNALAQMHRREQFTEKMPQSPEDLHVNERCGELIEEIQAIRRMLTEREWFILRYKFGIDHEEKTFFEIGRLLGLSGESVRLIYHQAIRKVQSSRFSSLN